MSKFNEYVDRIPPLVGILFATIIAAVIYSAVQIQSVQNCLERAQVTGRPSECKASVWFRLL
jgi:hypothetical protein